MIINRAWWRSILAPSSLSRAVCIKQHQPCIHPTVNASLPESIPAPLHPLLPPFLPLPMCMLILALPRKVTRVYSEPVIHRSNCSARNDSSCHTSGSSGRYISKQRWTTINSGNRWPASLLSVLYFPSLSLVSVHTPVSTLVVLV